MTAHHQVSAGAGRTSRRHRAMANQLRAQRGPCHICHQAIDYSLAYPHPDAFTVDHAISKRDRPDLAEDFGNYRAAHARCNWAKGADAAEPDLGDHADDW